MGDCVCYRKEKKDLTASELFLEENKLVGVQRTNFKLILERAYLHHIKKDASNFHKNEHNSKEKENAKEFLRSTTKDTSTQRNLPPNPTNANFDEKITCRKRKHSLFYHPERKIKSTQVLSRTRKLGVRNNVKNSDNRILSYTPFYHNY
jgi:hypothetical protein